MAQITNVDELDVIDHDGSAAGLKLGGTLVTSTAAELNQLDGFTGAVDGVAAGYALARGTQIATGTALVATGLATVVAFAISPLAATASTANAAVVVSAKNAATAGSINVYRWKITAPSTATLVAATAAGTVSWLAVGT